MLILGLTVAIVCAQIGLATRPTKTSWTMGRPGQSSAVPSRAVLPNGKVLLWAADGNYYANNGQEPPIPSYSICKPARAVAHDRSQP